MFKRGFYPLRTIFRGFKCKVLLGTFLILESFLVFDLTFILIYFTALSILGWLILFCFCQNDAELFKSFLFLAQKKVDTFVSTVHLPHPFKTEMNKVLVFTEVKVNC